MAKFYSIFCKLWGIYYCLIGVCEEINWIHPYTWGRHSSDIFLLLNISPESGSISKGDWYVLPHRGWEYMYLFILRSIQPRALKWDEMRYQRKWNPQYLSSERGFLFHIPQWNMFVWYNNSMMPWSRAYFWKSSYVPSKQSRDVAQGNKKKRRGNIKDVRQ